jgi:quercetin dioxygenase-like cupin family protein
VRHWRLPEVETPHGARSPVVLHSKEGAERAVLIELRAGEALGDHGVKESALLLVVDGAVRVGAGDESVDGDVGTLFHFDPDERRSVTSDGGARLLLLLAPWPGEGHYRGDRAARPAVSGSSPAASVPAAPRAAASGCARTGRSST